ncbi:glycosyltransferase family 2 protein [Pseudophaeobacter sp.]|uniref:glycosyltransferase family 2 protein n=1 Tax=Pseudophaeobacter sp. TaxID=1971739 RepID=UPI003299644F
MPLDLTIIIPCHNDAPHLERLLPRIAALGLARQLIVVDDGSDQPLVARDLQQASGLAAEQITLLRQNPPHGAGVARNIALPHVTSPHLLFLDADDLPTRELRDLCAALPHATPFDFCLFQHHDSRMERDHLWGQMPFDQAFWTQANLGTGGLQPVTSKAAQQLVQTANYPWNKIYRSDFLRDNDIRCSDTLVHNDIALHWQSFLQADRILASDHIGVVHFVAANGQRLTNRLGRERLRIFEPLEQVARDIAQSTAAYQLAFFSFAPRVLLWAHGTLQPELQPELRHKAQDFLRRHLAPQLRHELQQQRPPGWAEAQALFDF